MVEELLHPLSAVSSAMVCNRLCEGMFQTCFECGYAALPISPLLQTPKLFERRNTALQAKPVHSELSPSRIYHCGQKCSLPNFTPDEVF